MTSILPPLTFIINNNNNNINNNNKEDCYSEMANYSLFSLTFNLL